MRIIHKMTKYKNDKITVALAIWSYWHGSRERIFLNISSASNPWKTPKFLTCRCPQYEICPDGLSTRPQQHFTVLL